MLSDRRLCLKCYQAIGPCVPALRNQPSLARATRAGGRSDQDRKQQQDHRGTAADNG
jgi:hypothetical protein